MSPLSVGYSDLAVAAILVVLNAALTWMLDLGLSRIILIAGARAIVQLLLVGMVLKTVFALASPLLIGAVALAMFVMASYEISSRQERRFAGAWGYGMPAAPDWSRWRRSTSPPGESPTSATVCGSIGWRRNKMA